MKTQYSPKIDEYITLINKETSRPSFLHVTKIGRKYIYGKPIHNDTHLNRLVTHYYEAKYIMENHVILQGIHKNLDEIYKKYQTAVYEWRNERKEYHRRTEWEFRDEAYRKTQEKLAQWDEEHSEPQKPSLEEMMRK